MGRRPVLARRSRGTCVRRTGAGGSMPIVRPTSVLAGASPRKMRRNRSMRVWPWLAVGIGIGWLTAPRRGSSVRAHIRQKAWHWTRSAIRYAGRRGRDWRNRLAGTAVELRRATRPEPAVAPVTLAARVRSRLGRQFYLGQVEITADGGVIHLSGRMPSDGERERLIAAVRAVEGVHEVTAEHLRAA